jgi:hypothetical protein
MNIDTIANIRSIITLIYAPNLESEHMLSKSLASLKLQYWVKDALLMLG